MAKMKKKESQWETATNERLAEAGFRRGGARAAVVALLDEQSCALSAYEIEELLAARERAVGRASIYRILEQLDELGVVSKVELGQAQARYEPIRPDHHHHHLVCRACGDVVPFTDDALEDAIHRLSTAANFEVTGHDVVLHGSCAACRAAED